MTAPEPSDELPDFTGKVVIFYVQHPPPGADSGMAMEYVEFKRLGGRLFAIGRVPENFESEWVSRLPGAVAWDAVVHYLVFDSREDYGRRTASARPTLVQRFFNRGAG